MNKKIIVFAPHPDDETLGCGGTIAKRISEGYEVFIVEITDGKYLFRSVLGIDSNPTPSEVKQMRMDEAKKAAGILGVPEENVVFLEFEDGTLGEHEEEAEEKIGKMLVDHAPTEVYFPCAKDFHPDHRSANRIVSSSLRRMKTGVTAYQYSIMQTSRVGPMLDRLLNPIRKNMVNVDISPFLDLKRKAVDEFKSEVSVIAKGQTAPLLKNADRYLTTIESFYICP